MSGYPSSSSIRTIGLREVCEVNGRTFSRRKGTQEWTEHEHTSGLGGSRPPSPSSSLYLSLVHEVQGPGEPLHWSLFVGRENQPGHIYQVKGDAEHMRYQPSNSVTNIVQSDTFLNIYHLALLTEQQDMVVRQVAEQEPSPQAANRQLVTENCQGWTLRVIARLVEMGIVPTAKLQMARSMLQPV
ncbi:hypothetical protein PHISCL_03072 [Aspergillus sclerotialis]|uniref:Uncharacterized protein n=1 Tax=Aspergillus sclerotialis TaxID=2070753 RepID=A0A3A2ZYZ5_9EURO|nr:hypothetical protein PHISCL_03072 [Aspergillus sclerotialis]